MTEFSLGVETALCFRKKTKLRTAESTSLSHTTLKVQAAPVCQRSAVRYTGPSPLGDIHPPGQSRPPVTVAPERPILRTSGAEKEITSSISSLSS